MAARHLAADRLRGGAVPQRTLRPARGRSVTTQRKRRRPTKFQRDQDTTNKPVRRYRWTGRQSTLPNTKFWDRATPLDER
jgi:hypothetical protein